MDENKTMAELLEEECRKTLDAVSQARTQTDEAVWQLKKLGELDQLLVSEYKREGDEVYRAHEMRMKEAQLKIEKNDRIISNILTGAGIILPLGASCYWMAKGIQFEESGSFTSRAGQWVSNHLRLFKK